MAKSKQAARRLRMARKQMEQQSNPQPRNEESHNDHSSRSPSSVDSEPTPNVRIEMLPPATGSRAAQDPQQQAKTLEELIKDTQLPADLNTRPGQEIWFCEPEDYEDHPSRIQHLREAKRRGAIVTTSGEYLDAMRKSVASFMRRTEGHT